MQVRSSFNAWEEPMFLSSRAPIKDEKLFIRGRSSGVSMGIYAGEMTTLLQSWKLDSQGKLRKIRTREHSITPISNLHSNGSLFLEEPEILGPQSSPAKEVLLDYSLPGTILAAPPTLPWLRLCSLISKR